MRSPRPLQYGLIAEEVAEVAPQLVARGPDGEIDTVLYQFPPPLLLDAYQEQRRTIDVQQADLESLRRQLAALSEETQRLAAVLAVSDNAGSARQVRRRHP